MGNLKIINLYSLFSDLTKAFDMIDHELILLKLHTIGIRGPFHTFLKSYSEDKIQADRIADSDSKMRANTSGVPQGPTLGPMLFNIYVNDLGSVPIQSKLFQYADDAALILSHSDSALQCNLSKLIARFSRSSIFVNQRKTKLPCFRNAHKNSQLSLPIFINDKDNIRARLPFELTDRS